MSKNDVKKNKALHRRLSDIINPDPDAVQTSKLLEKIRPIARSYDSPLPEVDLIIQKFNDLDGNKDTIVNQDTVSTESTVSIIDTASDMDTVSTNNTVSNDNTESKMNTVFVKNTDSNEDTVSIMNTASKPENSNIVDTLSTDETVSIMSTVSDMNTVSNKNRASIEDQTDLPDPKLQQKDQTDLREQIKINDKTQYQLRIPYPKNTVSRKDTVSNENTVSAMNTVINKSAKPGFLEVPNSVADDIACRLQKSEWALYFRLFRLSHGWHKDTCIVGAQALINATHLSESQVRRSLQELVNMGLIEVLETINTRDLKGTKYLVNTVFPENTVSTKNTVSNKSTVPKNNTVSTITPNKEIDHDDLLNTDHHQSAHERETMMIYQSITGNSWSKTDQSAYEKIKSIEPAIIEQGIRITAARANSRPGSLAYFIKEILSIANPTPATRGQRKRDLEAIISRVRAAHTGQTNYSIADFSADVKDKCAREGVIFDHELFNEIIG